MTRLAAAQILAEDSEDLMGGFGSKPKVDRAGLLDEKIDKNGGSVAADVSNDFVSAADKFGVGNLAEGIGGTSVLDSGIAGGGVFAGSSNCQVARDGMLSDEDLSCTDKDGKTRIINQNADVNRGGMGLGLGRWNGERLEDQSHGFRVGDLVWGKIKGHPWWPGQVYDPRDASDIALKHSREGCVLVALFGDRSCSWCLPSQLLPFVENLDEKLRESSSKGFQTAVQMALNEICRVMESKILCKCIPLERRAHLARPEISNAAVRAGVLVPEVDIDRLPIPEYKPAELLAKVSDFARSGSFDSVFEHAVLRSWVAAYYLGKWGSRLHVYSEPRLIEGMEERDSPVNCFGPITVPNQDPKNQKQRAVTELMGNMHTVNQSAVKEGTYNVEGGLSSGKTSRKRRDDDTLVVNSGENEVATSGNTWVEAKEESEFVFASRERKKSKYLSPPYTSHHVKTGLKGYMPESKCDELMENSSGTSHDLSASPAYESDDKTLVQKKMTFPVSDVDVEVNELLQKLQVGAVECRYLRKEGHLDSIWGFISALRSSTYMHGEDYKVYHKSNRTSQKRRSLRLKALGPAEEPAQPTDNLVSDARVMRGKLDIITATLENYCSIFSSDDQSCLKKEMEHLMENVEATGAKVQAIADKHHLE